VNLKRESFRFQVVRLSEVEALLTLKPFDFAQGDMNILILYNLKPQHLRNLEP
jgi:hypothetical protein